MPDKTLATKDVRSMIESNDFKSSVAHALPAHLTPDRFVRIALTAMTRTPKLAECTPESVFKSLMLLSQFGLEPDGRNAHLIPFWNSNLSRTECQVIIDYKGLVDLAMRSGKVSYIHADKICENDVFKYDRGQVTKHEINFKEDRGKPYAYYAMARNKDGSEKFEVMTVTEVKAIRQRSRAKDSGPWVTDFDEMAKKTVFRRLSKWIQLSPEYREAIEHDMDALEQLKFASAKPVIARPVIQKLGNGKVDVELKENIEPAQHENAAAPGKQEASTADMQGGAEPPQPPKKKPAKLEKRKSATRSTVTRPNEAKLRELLAIGGFTESQFLEVMIANEWLVRDTKLADLKDEAIAQYVDPDNWQTIMDDLEKGVTK